MNIKPAKAFELSLVAAFIALSTPTTNETYASTILKNNTVSSVTGTGVTYQKAFQDARNRLPAGKGWFKVVSRKSMKLYYVTLYYR